MVVLLTGCFVARLAGGRGEGGSIGVRALILERGEGGRPHQAQCYPAQAPGTLTRAGAKDEK